MAVTETPMFVRVSCREHGRVRRRGVDLLSERVDDQRSVFGEGRNRRRRIAMVTVRRQVILADRVEGDQHEILANAVGAARQRHQHRQHHDTHQISSPIDVHERFHPTDPNPS